MKNPAQTSEPLSLSIREIVVDTVHLRAMRAFQKLSVLHAALTEPEQNYAYREGMERLTLEILGDLYWVAEMPEATLTIPCPTGDDITAIELGDTVCLIGIGGSKGRLTNAEARQYLPAEEA